ncbi:hypothetical protein FS842_000694 [Serendipita sp. 407]|nr:hypothetical protein FS842_000694 [Serendipita sp. 407]
MLRSDIFIIPFGALGDEGIIPTKTVKHREDKKNTSITTRREDGLRIQATISHQAGVQIRTEETKVILLLVE